MLKRVAAEGDITNMHFDLWRNLTRWFNELSKLKLTVCSCSDQRFGVAGVALQQQLEWHPGWRDGSWENDPDYRPHHLPHGVQAPQRALPHHRTTLVSPNTSFSVCHGFVCINAILMTIWASLENCRVFVFICWETYLLFLTELYPIGSMSLISGRHLLWKSPTRSVASPWMVVLFLSWRKI